MKISELLEMPDLKNTEMQSVPKLNMSYSFDTVKRVFDVIGKTDVDGVEYWALIKKDRSQAILGHLGQRMPANTPGLVIDGELEFKDVLDLAYFRKLDISPKNAIQVDGVQLDAAKRFKNMGSWLYLALARYGYVIVSDTLQFVGGQMLWKSLGRIAQQNGCSVYIIEEGTVMLDASGHPLKYNGANVPYEQLWAGTEVKVADRKKYTLFVLKRD